jgi:tRNA(adenine34) deaminase
MSEDEKWMRCAMKEAMIAQNKGEVPVGSILIKDSQIIAKAHNCPISNNDPTAHAEIEVLRKAGKILQNYRLPKTTLYTTLEPCTMCLGAIIHARIERIVFAASDPKSGAFGSSKNLISKKISNHLVKVSGGILEQENQKILKSFFQFRRK